MRNKNDLPTPLKLLKDFANTFPGCWERVEFMRAGKGKDLPTWNDLCYIPIAGTLAIMDLYKNADAGTFPAVLAALASWRQYKEIYSFSKDFSELLFEQADDIVVPTEALFALPYPCIYIKLDDTIIDGYFVHFEDDIHTHVMELRFLIVNNDLSVRTAILHLNDGWTIQDGVEDMYKSALKSAEDDEIVKQMQKHGYDISAHRENLAEYQHDIKEYYYDTISELIQPVLYICAQNAEVQENPEQKQITRKPKPADRPKDVFREIRKWDVGYRIGKAFAAHRNATPAEASVNSDKGPSQTSRKRPHARRGHWHHYWIGAQDNKKLILKWTAPMFINSDSDDIIPKINLVD